MPLPTSYTRKSLAAYMQSIVVATIGDTGWTLGDPDDATDAGDLSEPVNDVLLNIGLSDIAQITPDRILEVRLRARIAIWEAVTEEKVPMYDAGGLARTLSRSQIFEHAWRMLMRAESKLALMLRELALSTSGGMPTSGVTRVRTVWGTDDPYNPND